MFLDLDKKPKDKVAAIDDSGTMLTYSEMCDFSARFAQAMPPRTLVFILAENKIGSLLGYTSALSSGLVPLVISAKTEQSLYENLRDNKLMGAAFDVYPSEPIRPDEPYASLDNVTLSNHRGGDTVNCYADSPGALLVQCRRMFAGEEPLFWANKEALKALE